jgi:hypothetical protein
MVNMETPDQTGGGVTIVDAQLAASPVAVGVDRGLGHAKFAGDLLGRQVLVDQPQAFPFPGGEQADRIGGCSRARSHLRQYKRRRALYVQFYATWACRYAILPPAHGARHG